MPIKEFYLDKVLEGFEMDQTQFIDLCILLGCDYVDKIKVWLLLKFLNFLVQRFHRIFQKALLKLFKPIFMILNNFFLKLFYIH